MLKHTYKRVGIWLLFFTFLTALILSFLNTSNWGAPAMHSITLEVLGFLSLVLIAFSQEKGDNEYFNFIRFRSVAVTVLLSFAYALIDSFIFTVDHLLIMEIFQIQLLVYIVVFNLLKRIQ